MLANEQGIGDLQDTLQSVKDWSPLDWLVVLGGSYIVWSVLFTSKRTYEAVTGKVRGIKSKSEKRKRLMKELNETSIF